MKIVKYLLLLASIVALTACEQELTENVATDTGDLLICVGDFPAFAETPETRAIGIPDEGKTAWTSGDQLLLHLSYTNDNGAQDVYSTLTYDGTTWTASPALTLERAHSASLTAYYAPAYALDGSGNLTGTAGTAEFLQTTQTLTSRQVNIDFSTTQRTYSRLRIAGSSGTNLHVSITDFTPAGSGTASDSYVLTTDDKGNAYLYGSWTSNCNLNVTYGNTSLVSKDNISASVANTSYAVEASFASISNPTACGAIGDGTQNYPYILRNGAQLYDLATNSSANRGAYYKMDADIDLSAYSSNWTSFFFSGTFDGNGHAITGFNYSYSATIGQNFGLFNQNNGTIKNLTIKDCQITNDSYNNNTAAIAAQNNAGGVIENCHVVGGSISSIAYASGIVAMNVGGRIIACSNSAALSGSDVAGISYMVYNNASFIGCYNTGELKGSNSSAGVWSQAPFNGTVTTSSCYTIYGNIYNYIGMVTVNINQCYWLNGSVITEQSGTTVDSWQTAMENMNSTLQSGGYAYQYVLEDGLPKIERTD